MPDDVITVLSLFVQTTERTYHFHIPGIPNCLLIGTFEDYGKGWTGHADSAVEVVERALANPGLDRAAVLREALRMGVPLSCEGCRPSEG